MSTGGDFPRYAEMANVQGAMSGMVQSFAIAAQMVGQRFQQLGADSAAMWAIAMTSPTFMAATGQRIATESGSGRTRVESNTPASSQITGP